MNHWATSTQWREDVGELPAAVIGEQPPRIVPHPLEGPLGRRAEEAVPIEPGGLGVFRRAAAATGNRARRRRTKRTCPSRPLSRISSFSLLIVRAAALLHAALDDDRMILRRFHTARVLGSG